MMTPDQLKRHREYQKKWRDSNKERQKAIASKSRKKHAEYHRERLKKYRKEEIEQVRKQNREYISKRKAIDPSFRLSRLLRSRLCKALKTNQKKGSAVRDLGCTILFLKEHLEAKFHDRVTGEKMSWENWGQKGWHIDHIIPLCQFDLTDRNQLAKAVHYSNLQPLWMEDNLSKRKRA